MRSSGGGDLAAVIWRRSAPPTGCRPATVDDGLSAVAGSLLRVSSRDPRPPDPRPPTPRPPELSRPEPSRPELSRRDPRLTDRWRPAHVSFEESSSITESAERVTDRRRDLNKWNYSIMTATLLAIGGVLAWSTYAAQREFVGGLGVIGLSLMAALHCSYWIHQIDDFKALNTEKFRLLNEMAPHVRFPDSGPGITIRSYEPFRREWDAMDELRPVVGDPALRRRPDPGAQILVGRIHDGAGFSLRVFVLRPLGTIALLRSDFHDVIHNVTPLREPLRPVAARFRNTAKGATLMRPLVYVIMPVGSDPDAGARRERIVAAADALGLDAYLPVGSPHAWR